MKLDEMSKMANWISCGVRIAFIPQCVLMLFYSNRPIVFPVCFVFEADGFSFAPRAEVWECGILVKAGSMLISCMFSSFKASDKG